MMEFRALEAIVIDVLRTPELQRLRRIRQLGLGHLVYPGAEHSRLVHSLGTAHLAIRFGRQLQEVASARLVPSLTPGATAVRDFAVAALCHDLGHGPLSHAWEREIVGENYDVRRWATALGVGGEQLELQGLKWHELVGQALLAWPDGQLHRLLESHETGFTERVRALLTGDFYIPYLPGLLHGDIDIDRADFLKRDTLQCGASYGDYDLDWLVSTCTVGARGDRLVVGFDGNKAVRVAEHFLTARRALYDTVYYHRTVRAAEGMVAQLVQRLRQVLTEDIAAVGRFVGPIVRMIAGEVLTPEELLSLDDFALWVLMDAVANSPTMDVTARDLARRILARDLFKLVPCDQARVTDFLMRENSHQQIYDAIRPFCPGLPEHYLVVDRAKFEMLSEGERDESYFISDWEAVPIREHPVFQRHRGEVELRVRLFTIREAVEAVHRLISQQRG